MNRLDNKGSVAIILSIAIVVLFGFAAFVIDIGLVYSEKTRLSNAIDSAVLAAAMELPQNPINARVVANQYLQLNNVLPSEVIVSISSDNKTIEIEGQRSVNHVFAPIIGIYNSDVNANTRAQIGPVKSIRGGIKPFAVESYNFVYGQLMYFFHPSRLNGVSL